MSDPAPQAWPAEHVTQCDVVVIGASFGGLVSAALLADAGLQTVVIDPLPMVGAPGGALRYRGYWIPWGHRDGWGMRQHTFTVSRWILQIADRLGVSLDLVGPHDPAMLLHLVPPGDVIEVGTGSDSFELLAREALLLPPENVPEFADLFARLKAMTAEEAQALLAVTVGDWLRESHVSQASADALLAYLRARWVLPPEMASIGRFIINHLHARGSMYTARGHEFGGNQEIVEAFADKARSLGADICLDLKPDELIVEGGRVVGVRARNPNGFVHEVRARTVVFTGPAYMLFQHIAPDHFPAAFVEQAWSTKKYETPILGLFMGLRDLPKRRSDGERDTTICWQRVLFGPDRAYGGGWSVWSNGSPGLAPPGKHLLGVHLSDEGTSQGYEAARRKLGRVVQYMRQYYSDLEDLVDWYEYQWMPEPTGMSWAYKIDERAPMRAPIGGLFLVGYTTEVTGVDYEAEAHSALDVANMIVNA